MSFEHKSDLKAVWPSDPKHYQWKGTLSNHNGLWNILAHCKPRKEDVFIKIKETQDCLDTEIDEFTETTKNLINIHHRNLLTPVHAFVDKSEIWVIYPRHSGGPLIEVLTSHYPNGIHDESIVSSILYDICLGLHNLHKQQQCHRNICASSIHIDIDSGDVLLSEFAELKEIKWKHAAGRRNTFVSPEREPFTDPLILFSDESASWYAGDIYAFGVTALQLTYGSTPPLNIKNLLHAKSSAITVDLYDRKCPFSKAFEALIKDCCAPNIANRISINKLIQHKLFTKNNNKLNKKSNASAIKQYFGHILKSTEKRINSALNAPQIFNANGTYQILQKQKKKKKNNNNNNENINELNNNNVAIEKEKEIIQEIEENNNKANAKKTEWIFSTTIHKSELDAINNNNNNVNINGPTMHNTMAPNTNYNDPSHDDNNMNVVNIHNRTKRNYHVSFSGSESISHDPAAELVANNNNNNNNAAAAVQINRFKVEFDSRMSDSGTVGTHLEPSQTNDDEYEIEDEHNEDINQVTPNDDDVINNNDNNNNNMNNNSEQTTQIKRFFITPAKHDQDLSADEHDDIHDNDSNATNRNIDKLKWSANDCSKWVGSLGDLYKQYMKAFIDNGIDGALLTEIDDDTLKEIINSALHRKKILIAWAQLQK